MADFDVSTQLRPNAIVRSLLFPLLMTATPQNSNLFLRLVDKDVYGGQPGHMAAEAMSRFSAQKNHRYFQLECSDYKDESGKNWPVEIEDMLPLSLLEAFITQPGGRQRALPAW